MNRIEFLHKTRMTWESRNTKDKSFAFLVEQPGVDAVSCHQNASTKGGWTFVYELLSTQNCHRNTSSKGRWTFVYSEYIYYIVWTLKSNKTPILELLSYQNITKKVVYGSWK